MKRLFFLLASAGSLMAQTEQPNFFNRDHDNCFSGATTRISLRHRESGGVGYDDGYTTLGVFLSPNSVNRFQYFFDGRGHVLNDGKFASNLGGGIRVAALEKLAIGLNSYWDFRQVKHLPSHQLGGGLEILSPYADFRLNGYFPFGDKTYVEDPKFRKFSGNRILVRQKSKAELTTIYGEVGFPVPGPFRAVDLYLAAGPYYIFTRTVGLQGGNKGKTPAAWGGKFRSSLRVYDGIELGMDVTYDHVFTWNVQGYLSLSFPLGPANMRKKGKRWKKRYGEKCEDAAKYMAMMTQPVQRNEIIPILEKRLGSALSANCLFVNNSFAVNGNGTFEFPFNNLQAAENASNPSDCIYVFQGSGVYDTQYGGLVGFLLKDGQVITGSGISFLVNGVTIPPQTPSNPVVTNSAGSIIALASGVTIQGLTLRGTPGGSDAIHSTGTNRRNVTIDQNIIENNDGFPIRGLGVTPVGFFRITNNIFRNNALAGAGDEIFLGAFAGGSLTFSNNFMSVSQGGNRALQFVTNSTATTDMEYMITNNTITNVGGGTVAEAISIQGGGGPISNQRTTAVFTDNTLTNTGLTGLLVDSNALAMSVHLLRNTFSGHATNDAYVLVTGPGITIEAEVVAQSNRFGTRMTFETQLAGNTNQICLDLSNHAGPLIDLTNTTGDPANFRAKSTDGDITGVQARNPNTTVVPTSGAASLTYPPVNSTCY